MKRLPVFVVVLLICGATALSAEFYVGPDGSKAGPGTRAKPFATLGQARDAVRTLNKDGQLPAGGVTVWLKGGVYTMAVPFELKEVDSGSADSPVVYRAVEGEKPRLVGGRVIEPAAFKPVSDPKLLGRIDKTARKNVLTADLGALGIPPFAELADRFETIGAPELFVNDRPMQVARWPNEGWVNIEKVIDRGVGKLDREFGEFERGIRGGTFVYSGDRPKRWATARSVWLYGFWCHDWASECIKVGTIDTEKRQNTMAVAHVYGIGPSSKWNKHPRRYYALNLLEELDAPGEWFLDRKANVLYFWPPEPLDEARIVVSILQKPLVTLRNTSHITLRGLRFETSYGGGVSVLKGTGNLVAGCTFSNLTGPAVQVAGGTKNGVVGCDLHGLGRSGITISGGDRKKLVPAGNYALNNHIHHFGRLQRTYAAAIHISGVGNRAAHNLIHDAPHSALFYGGNEHVIELNEIHHVAQETSDVGVFYTGRDWTSRGNLVRWNYFHDLPTMPGCGTMGIYLDDCDSGDRLVGNVFHRAGRYASFIGGGRDNLIENNLYIECIYAVHIDARGLSRCKPGSGVKDGWDLLAKAQALDYLNPPWSTRYPKLARVMDEEPLLPLGNVIRNNLAVDCDDWLHGDAKKIIDRFTFENNLVLKGEDPGFVDRAGGDFRLKPNSIVHKKLPGFKPIPFERIGLYKDEYRPNVEAR